MATNNAQQQELNLSAQLALGFLNDDDATCYDFHLTQEDGLRVAHNFMHSPMEGDEYPTAAESEAR